MRIALTCNFSPWSAYFGGAQRSTHALASALVERGHDVHVVYTERFGVQPSAARTAPYRAHFAPFVGVRPRRTSPLRSLNALTVHLALRKLDREAPLDVVHSQGEEGVLVEELPFRRRVRFIVTPRYPSYPRALRPGAGLLSRAKLWATEPKYVLLGRALARADQVCSTSEASATELRRAFGLGSRRIEVIPNGVDAGFFTRSWRGPRKDAPLVFFGRIEQDKGVDILLHAMRQCQRELLVIGRGAGRDAFVALARELGVSERVRFLDWMEPGQLADVLASSALAVLPSRAESFGNAMVEAMATGVPLVSTRAGSIPEVVGDAAELVQPGDAAELGAAVSSLLLDHERAVHLSEAGRRRVRDNFTWSAVAMRYEALYRRGT